MSDPVDYYVAAIVDGIEQNMDAGTREDGACALPLRVIHKYYSKPQIIGTQPVLTNSNLLKMALSHLSEKNLVEVWDDEFADTVIYVENPQNLFDSMSENRPFQRLYMLKDNGHGWLIDALEAINSADVTASGTASKDVVSDEAWSPLPLDRHDAKFLEAVLAVEDALSAIEGDNGYAVTEPEERNAILLPAKGTLQALKEGMPSRDQVVATLLKPLTYLAKKFSDGIIGVAAKKAGDALMAWLGLM